MTKDSFEVGYRKPPKHTRFKSGQSGNPKGRPKGIKNLATDLQEELEQKILITEANQTLEVTKQRAMVKTLLAKALKGDTRASQVLINLTLGLEEARKSSSEVELVSEEDQAVLNGFKDRLMQQILSTNASKEDENE